jgi:TetR/AcrR family transcriptional regulator
MCCSVPGALGAPALPAWVLPTSMGILPTSGDCTKAIEHWSPSLRLIADQAGVQHQLVVHHFKTKDTLWRAVVASFFDDDALPRLRAALEARKAEGPDAALRELVQRFVLFTAGRPAFHRIATFEGRTDNERLRWLLDRYVRAYYELSTDLIRAAQAAGVARPGDPGQLHYAVIGLVTTSFVFASEYRAMTGLEPFESHEIDKTVELACDFLGIAAEAQGKPRGKARDKIKGTRRSGVGRPWKRSHVMAFSRTPLGRLPTRRRTAWTPAFLTPQSAL